MNIVDKKGDVWLARPCDEHGCVVLEHHLKRDVRNGVDDEPRDLHIPIGVIERICDELMRAVCECNVD